MHDHPQALPGRAFARPDHRVIALSGRDASAFAQAQLMNDLKLLAPGRWQWNGWLTPKGRVIALFVFRAKVAIAVRDDLHVEGAFALSQQARGNELAGDPASGVELDFSADAGPRTLRIVPDSTASRDAVWMQRWAAFDLAHGLPRLPASQSDHWTPQQLSLDRLNAFSVKKGCYPGQEIVARTHFLGKVKRGLALIEGSEAMRAGDDLLAGGQPLGHLVASADDGERHLALAVVPLEREPVALQACAIEVREVPLGEGLAR